MSEVPEHPYSEAPDEPTPPPTLREVAAGTRYPVEAFNFVRRGLDYTVHRIHSDPEQMAEEDRHVDGKQLCLGLRDYAIDQYGMLAQMVLGRWHIHRTEDFGHIVFAMVESRLMKATEGDSIRDFYDGFNFEQAFSTRIPVDHVPPTDPRHSVEQDGNLD